MVLYVSDTAWLTVKTAAFMRGKKKSSSFKYLSSVVVDYKNVKTYH